MNIYEATTAIKNSSDVEELRAAVIVVLRHLDEANTFNSTKNKEIAEQQRRLDAVRNILKAAKAIL